MSVKALIKRIIKEDEYKKHVFLREAFRTGGFIDPNLLDDMIAKLQKQLNKNKKETYTLASMNFKPPDYIKKILYGSDEYILGQLTPPKMTGGISPSTPHMYVFYFNKGHESASSKGFIHFTYDDKSREHLDGTRKEYEKELIQLKDAFMDFIRPSDDTPEHIEQHELRYNTGLQNLKKKYHEKVLKGLGKFYIFHHISQSIIGPFYGILEIHLNGDIIDFKIANKSQTPDEHYNVNIDDAMIMHLLYSTERNHGAIQKYLTTRLNEPPAKLSNKWVENEEEVDLTGGVRTGTGITIYGAPRPTSNELKENIQEIERKGKESKVIERKEKDRLKKIERLTEMEREEKDRRMEILRVQAKSWALARQEELRAKHSYIPKSSSPLLNFFNMDPNKLGSPINQYKYINLFANRGLHPVGILNINTMDFNKPTIELISPDKIISSRGEAIDINNILSEISAVHFKAMTAKGILDDRFNRDSVVKLDLDDKVKVPKRKGKAMIATGISVTVLIALVYYYSYISDYIGEIQSAINSTITGSSNETVPLEDASAALDESGLMKNTRSKFSNAASYAWGKMGSGTNWAFSKAINVGVRGVKATANEIDKQSGVPISKLSTAVMSFTMIVLILIILGTIYRFIDYIYEILDMARPPLVVFGDNPEYDKLKNFLSNGRISNIKLYLRVLDEKDDLNTALRKFETFERSYNYTMKEAKTPEYFDIFKSSGGNKQTRMKRRIHKGNITRKMRGGGPSFVFCGTMLVACRILQMLNNPSMYKFANTSDFLKECYNQIVHIKFIKRSS